MMKKKIKKIKKIDILVYGILCCVSIVCIYPILLIVFNAFTEEAYVLKNGYVWWPVGISFDAFRFLFGNMKRMLTSLGVTIFECVVGVGFSMFVNALAAYPLTRDDFWLKKPFKIFLMIHLFLPGGGAIATYIINTQWFHFENNLLVYVLPGAAAVMTIFLYRVCFQSIPKELLESARIDGASEMQCLGRIILPLSVPFFATQYFMSFVARWKEYGTSLWYMINPNLQTLEHYIQQVVADMEILKQNVDMTGIGSAADIPTNTMQFAIVLISLVPIMVIFPLLQKYFEKGMIVGSIKG